MSFAQSVFSGPSRTSAAMNYPTKLCPECNKVFLTSGTDLTGGLQWNGPRLYWKHVGKKNGAKFTTYCYRTIKKVRT